MALFGSEPTFFQIVVSCVYRYVIMATLVSLAFLYYLFRTKAPLKEHAEDNEDETGQASISNGVLANGNLHVWTGGDDKQLLLDTIINGIRESDNAAAQDELEEKRNSHIANGHNRVLTAAEDEEQEGETHHKRRHVIREVTVRKIFLPPEASYAEIENAAKTLVTNSEQMSPRKNSGTGGPDFRAAIRNIRAASKRLEDDDISPVPRGYQQQF